MYLCSDAYASVPNHCYTGTMYSISDFNGGLSAFFNVSSVFNVFNVRRSLLFIILHIHQVFVCIVECSWRTELSEFDFLVAEVEFGG